ncbi:MAG: DUF2723 domain-containing protein [Roseiflexaceae bacterium]
MPEAVAATQLDRTHSRIDHAAATIIACALAGGALMLYLRTGAPSILSGDAAEHQFSAVLVGVPHATGYPLFTMLNAVAVRVIPFGDAARRVTVAVALYSAIAVLLAHMVSRQLTGSLAAGLLAAITLALAPEFWALATIAEVYTLQALFLLGMLLALLRWWQIETHESNLGLARRGLRHPLAVASLLGSLGATHHGSFMPIVAPALFAAVVGPLLWRMRDPAQRRPATQLFGRCVCWGLAGCAPWLYLVAQYMLFRPFDYYRGQGLPYHPYWGNPQSWGDVLNLALGAGFRSKILTHGWNQLATLLPGYLLELRRQFTLVGLGLGTLGALNLLRSSSRIGRFTILVWLTSTLFGLNVAADVPKAHVYFLPAYVIWSLWIGAGSATLATIIGRVLPTGIHRLRPFVTTGIPLLLLVPVIRGAYPFGPRDLSGHWNERREAEQILMHVEPDAVIICRWEECMSLRYLQLVEGRQLGVQLDQSEALPGETWADRAALYLPSHPVYAVGDSVELADRYRLFPLELEGSIPVFRVEAPGNEP